MVRKKNTRRPSRLPATNARTSLSAYEVRLSAVLPPTATETEWANADEMQQDPSMTQDLLPFAAEAIRKDSLKRARQRTRKGKRLSKQPRNGLPKRLVRQLTPPPHLDNQTSAIVLCRGKLPIKDQAWPSESDVRMTIETDLPEPDSDGTAHLNVCLSLIDPQQNTKNTSSTVQQSDEKPPSHQIFLNDAGFWFGGSRSQLDAFALLNEKQLLVTTARIKIEDEPTHDNASQFVEYTISVAQAVLVATAYTKMPLEEWVNYLPVPPVHRTKIGRAWLTLMHWFYPLSMREASELLRTETTSPATAQSAAPDLARVIQNVKPSSTAPECEESMPGLLPELRPYQRRAVHWAISRERGVGSDGVIGHVSKTWKSSNKANGARSWWHEMLSCDGQPFFFCPFAAAFSVDAPPLDRECLRAVRGGILADSMGLGKTVEVLGLVVAHPRPGQQIIDKQVPPAAINPSEIDENSIDSTLVNNTNSSMQSDDGLRSVALQRVGTVVSSKNDVEDDMDVDAIEDGSKSPIWQRACPCTQLDVNMPGGWISCSQCASLSHLCCTPLWQSGTNGDVLQDADRVVRVVRNNECELTAQHKSDNVAAPTTQHAQDSTGDERTPVLGSQTVPDEWLCSSCQGTQSCVAARTTLVICPAPILKQWEQEIAKHVKAGVVKVGTYEGVPAIVEQISTLVERISRRVARVSPSQTDNISVVTTASALLDQVNKLSCFLYAGYLATHFDVMLMTYDILRKDLHHLGAMHRTQGYGFRSSKRFVVQMSPLTQVRWWRVCVDEAQIVEASTSKATEAARCLIADNRWCVSGTPVGPHGLDDLWGLLVFLGVEPYCRRAWWRSLVWRTKSTSNPLLQRIAEERLTHVLGELLWRNTKHDVAHELKLPKLSHNYTFLNFSLVEKHFYETQRREVVRTVADMMEKAGVEANRRSANVPATSPSSLRLAPPSPLAPRQRVGRVVVVDDEEEEEVQQQQQQVEMVENVGPSGLVDNCRSVVGVPTSEEIQIIDDDDGDDNEDEQQQRRSGNEQQSRASGSSQQQQQQQSAIDISQALAPAMKPLLRLRQACCHPEIGSFGVRRMDHHRYTNNANNSTGRGSRRRRNGTTRPTTAAAAASGALNASGGGRATGDDDGEGGGRRPMTMAEVLENLLHKAKLDSEENQRKVLMTRNGIAALQDAMGQPELAERTYVASLRLMDRYKTEHDLKSDSLQRFHTLFHLRNLLVNASGSVSNTNASASADGEAVISVDDVNGDQSGGIGGNELQVARIDRQVQEIKSKHMMRWEGAVSSAIQAREKATETVNKLEQQMLQLVAPAGVRVSKLKSKSKSSNHHETWWGGGLLRMYEAEGESANGRCAMLIERIRSTALANKNKEGASICRNVRSIVGLAGLLAKRLDEIEELRNKALRVIDSVTLEVSDAQVRESANCKVCRSYFQRQGDMCGHCKIERVIRVYESKLFSFRRKRAAGRGSSLAAGNSSSNAHAQSPFVEQGDEDEEGYAYREPCEAHSVLRLVWAALKSGGGGGGGITHGSLNKAANAYFERNTALGTELLAMSRVWREGDFHLKALDELEMHKIKMRLVFPGELIDPGDELWKLQEADVSFKRHELEVELRGHEHSFNESVSQLRYLRNLGQQSNSHPTQTSRPNTTQSSIPNGAGYGSGSSVAVVNGSSSGAHPSASVGGSGQQMKQNVLVPCNGYVGNHIPETPGLGYAHNDFINVEGQSEELICVVCREELKGECAVLACAHQFCSSCIRIMIQRAASNYGGRVPVIKCPTCRKLSAAPEIKYASMDSNMSNSNNEAEKTNNKIKHTNMITDSNGRSSNDVQEKPSPPNPYSDAHRQELFGTKLDAVVGKLIELERQEPTAKVLVFSQWEQVMDILERALMRENLSYVRLENLNKRFYERLDFFKRDPSIRVLLLPVKSGANGLNLTEATHVVMVDPLLDRGVEAQAINRVHRLGQTKHAWVHHFIIRGTVEERILSLRGKHVDSEVIRVGNGGAGAEVGEGEEEEVEDMLNVVSSREDGLSMADFQHLLLK